MCATTEPFKPIEGLPPFEFSDEEYYQRGYEVGHKEGRKRGQLDFAEALVKHLPSRTIRKVMKALQKVADAEEV